MLYVIGKRLLQNEWVGWLAGVFYALYPYLVFQNLTLIDTPLFITELHAFVLIMVLLRERDQRDRVTWGLALLGGLVWALATLTRPILLPLAALVGVWFLFRRSLIDSLLRLLPVAVVSLLVLVPWIVRNEAVYDAFVPISISGRLEFLSGQQPGRDPVSCRRATTCSGRGRTSRMSAERARRRQRTLAAGARLAARQPRPDPANCCGRNS